MEEMMAAIMQANEDEIEKILQTAIHRKRELYPEWEITYQASLKGTEERRAGDDLTLAMGKKEPVE
ncbi:MAG: hypothetical protein SOW84_08125 [Candidatus Faecousia sp.]|nr:hypothetical protein [Candidatus Faecousia sp.]